MSICFTSKWHWIELNWIKILYSRNNYRVIKHWTILITSRVKRGIQNNINALCNPKCVHGIWSSQRLVSRPLESNDIILRHCIWQGFVHRNGHFFTKMTTWSPEYFIRVTNSLLRPTKHLTKEYRRGFLSYPIPGDPHWLWNSSETWPEVQNGVTPRKGVILILK